MTRRLLGVLLALLALAAAVPAALSTPPGRDFLKGRLEKALAERGVLVRIGSLEILPARRSLVLGELSLALPGGPELARARELRVRLPLAVLLGRRELDGLEVRGLALRYVDAAGGLDVRVEGASLSLQRRGRTLAGGLSFPSPLRARAGERSLAAALSELPLAHEGDALRFGPLELRAQESALEVEGTLAGLSGTPRLLVEIAGRLDLAALAGSPQTVAGTLAVEARLRGSAPEPVADLTLRSPALRLAGVELRDAECAATIESGGLAVSSLRARVAGGSLEARGRAGGGGAGELSASWSRVELAGLLDSLGLGSGARGPRASLSGRLQAEWPSGRWREARATASLVARPAGTRGLPLSGEARLAAANGAWLLALERVSAAGVLLDGEVRGGAEQAAKAAALEGRLRLTAEDVGAAWSRLKGAGEPVAAGRLTADVRLSGSLAEPELAIEVAGRGLALRGTQLAAGALDGRGRLTTRAAVVERLAFEAPAVRARASGRFELSSGALSGSLEAAVPDWALFAPALPAGLDPSGPASLQLRLEGRWPEPRAQLALSGGPLEVGGQRLALVSARLVADSRTVRIEELLADPADGGRARLSGSVALEPARESSLSIELEDADLTGAARRQLPRFGRLIASLSGALRGPLGGAGPSLEASVARLEAELGGREIRLVGPGRLAAGPTGIHAESLVLRSGDSELSLEGSLGEAAGSGLRARLVGRLEDLAAFAPEPPAVAGPIEAGLDWGGSREVPSWAGQLKIAGASGLGFSDVAVAAEYHDGLLDLSRLSARHPLASVTASGRAAASLLAAGLPEPLAALAGDRPPHAALHVEVHAERLSGAAGREAEAGAGATLVADLETDALDLRRVRGTVALSNVVLRTETARLEQEPGGRLEIADGRLRLFDLGWTGAASSLRLRGEARLAEGEAPLGEASLDLGASGRLDLRLLGAVAAGVEAGGAAELDLRVRGRAAEPELQGEVRLREGQLRYRPRRLSLDGLSGRIALRNGGLRLEGLEGTFNGGSFEASGSLDLEGLAARSGRLEARARRATLDWPRGFLGEADADVALDFARGTTTLSGDVALAFGSYTGNPRVAFLEFEEWRALPAQPSVFDPLRFDLRVRTLQDVEADTIYGRLGMSADFKVSGRYDAPELQGRLQARPGAELFLGGRSYLVESLTLDYTKAGGLIPFLRTRAATRASGYDVTADFTGPLDAPQAQLSSDPPLGEREIASLLTTGRTGASGASSDAVSLVAADFLGGVGRSFGFDTVRLQTTRDEDLLSADPTAVVNEANPQSRLTVTKRLAENLQVTLSQALAEGGKRTTAISYKPLPGLEARAAQRDDQTYAAELRHDLSFGSASPAARGRRARRAPEGPPVAAVDVTLEAPQAGSPALPGQAQLARRLRLRAGDRFSYERWLADRDRLQEELARAGYFDARVFATREPREAAAGDEPIRLSYTVRPGPRTEVALEGFAAPASLVRRIERAWWLSEFASSLEEEAARLVRAHLVERGHALARVSARLGEPGADGVKRLRVAAEPGPRAERLAVEFHGQARLAEAALSRLAPDSAARRAAFADPGSLERALLKLAESEGLLAARVTTHAEMSGARAVLRVEIEEGPPFALQSLAIEGTAGLPESAVREAAGLEPGTPFREAAIQAARERVRRLYREQGFVEASIRLEGVLAAEPPAVAATLQVAEGPRQVVREVVVDGDSRFGERLAGEAGLREGQAVVLEDWTSVRRRLYETGLLRGVELRAEPLLAGEPASGETQPVRARLTLQDWPSLRLRYGLQLAGTRDPLAEEGRQSFRLGGIAELSRQTLFGRALAAGASAQARQGFQLGRAYLSAARTLGAPLRSSLFVTRRRSELPVAVFGTRSLFQEDSTDVTFEERFKPGPLVELAAAYGVEWTRLFGDIFFVGPLDLRLRVARLTGTALLDGRDNLIDPLRGYFHSTSLEYGAPALGSEFRFNRLLVQQYGYLPAGPLLLASAARLERSSGPDQALLNSGRLAAGGANTVRGYPEDFGDGGLGATDAVSTLLVLNQELRVPLWAELYLGAFADHASRWRSGDGRVLARTSLGLGLRYRTAVGVLRLDFGYPLAGAERKGRFYFALGQAF